MIVTVLSEGEYNGILSDVMKIAHQVAEMERRQRALLHVIRKELDHTKRLVRLSCDCP